MQRSHNDFNPRAPYGARPLLRPAQAHAPWHFNPRAPYGARLASLGHGAWIYTDFNPRAPYGARHVYARYLRTNFEFQSTRPIRGATPPRSMPWARPLYFNPRAPYGARLAESVAAGEGFAISIHAPHMGRDGKDRRPLQIGSNFNPRAPYGARQQKCIKCIIYVLHFCNNRQPKHKSQQETSSVRTFF